MNELGVGILGAGTVGSEVARRLVDAQSRVTLSDKAGVNLRLNGVFTRNPQGEKSQDIYRDHSGLFRNSPEEIISSPDVQVIVETMGGTEEALRVIELALRAGKHVVTANKDLLSQDGARLLTLAQENNVNIGVEAAVMGGIPVINALTNGLAGDEIKRIVGIANGTSNYILTEMKKRGLSFDVALREAQELGYAEFDPTNDIKGFDAAYKLSLLTFLGFGKDVKIGDFNQLEGIDALDAIDFKYLEDLKSKVKLLAIAERTKNNTLTLMVAPHVLDMNHPLAQVDGALNAVEISGLAEGAPNFLRGKGAGNIPTSNSILSDLVNIARGGGKIWIPKLGNHMQLTGPDDILGEYYLRVTTNDDAPGILGRVATCLGENGINIEQTRQLRGSNGSGLNIPFVITTGVTNQATMRKVVGEIKGMENIGGVVSMRML